MGLDFLRHYGGRRLRPYVEQPTLGTPDGEDEKSQVELDFEQSPGEWDAKTVDGPLDADALPRRFIDGCHNGETVAWLQDFAGHPIPVRLAEIGGVCMRLDGRDLRREFAYVERVVSLIADPFPWHEVEAFAGELRETKMRLLTAPPPTDDEGTPKLTYDYEKMRQPTYSRCQNEMRVLEELALHQAPELLSLVDGRLGRIESDWVIGVVKQHRETYLDDHPECWQVFYRLEPGQRTPAFRLPSKPRPVVSWYLKLDGAHGALPNWGIVRVEISDAHFERCGRSSDYLDRLSRGLLHLRCRQASYARAPVSLGPIVRAEESLKSLFSSPATLAQRFYHLTGL